MLGRRGTALGALVVSVVALCACSDSSTAAKVSAFGASTGDSSGGGGKGGDGGASGAPSDGLSHYTCKYVNPFNAAQQCKEYALEPGDEAARNSAETDCKGNPIGRTIDLGDPGTFAQGTCTTAGAVGYCTMPDGSRDYVFDADCSTDAPSAQWGCEDQAGGKWTCLAGEDHSTERSKCEYVNPFNNALQCKEYRLPVGDREALAAAQADCTANPIGGSIQEGTPGTFTQDASCKRDGAVGYCLMPDGALDFVFDGDCSDEAPSAKWGCEDQAGGKWVCIGEPNIVGDKYTCTYVNPFNQATQCKEYTLPTGDAAAVTGAKADCDANPIGGSIDQGKPGDFATGTCERGGAIGYCLGTDSSMDFVFDGDCSAEAPSAKWGCEDQAGGVWVCLLDDGNSGGNGGGGGGTPVPDQYSCTWKADGGYLGSDYSVCREYGFALDEAGAKADCDGKKGKLDKSACSRTSVVGYCPGTYDDIYYDPASCNQAFGKVSLQDDCGASRVCGSAPAVPDPNAPVENCNADDAGVISCRYSSSFDKNNCADFPASDGWTEADVKAHCSGLQGADASTVVVVTGQSCLVERGAKPSAVRCHAITNAKDWYAYGTPEFVCTSFIAGSQGLEQGPFCSPY